MKITYMGHSCFKIESRGYSIILDPYERDSVPGYTPVQESSNAILCSHRHRDHCGVECVTLNHSSNSPFTVETISTWHDDQQGTLRGENTIHILDDGQCRIAHLGDLGCELNSAQKGLLKGLTALLIPVGGYYTIDAAQANTLVNELNPVVIIPMHYRSESFGYDVIGTLDQFTKLRDDVAVYSGSELELTLETSKQTAVLKPQNV